MMNVSDRVSCKACSDLESRQDTACCRVACTKEMCWDPNQWDAVITITKE